MNGSGRQRKKRAARKRRRPVAARFVIGLVSAAAVLYAAAGTYLYLNQENLIYHPTRGVEQTGERTVEFAVEGAILRGWEVNPGREHAIIYFGGNAERIERAIPDYRDFFPEHTLYFVNYRGYGASTGKPSEDNLCNDAVAVFDAVSRKHDNVTVIGRSLGSGVAAYLAANRPVYQLVLVTPFDCLSGVAQRMYPLFPVKLIMKDEYDSAGLAPEITAPTLVVIAGNDQMIPRESTDRLIEAFSPGTVRVAVMGNATHDDVTSSADYFIRIRDFQITGD